MPVQTAIQTRRGTASSWTSTNPTLAAGEIGFETDTGKFKIGTGSSAWNSLPYAAINASLLDAKGDLIAGTADNTPARLASSGVNGDVLQVDTSTATGLKWATPASGMSNPMTTTGDIIYSSSGSTPARRGIGSTGQVLTVSGGLPVWATPTTSAIDYQLINAGGTALTGSTTVTVSGISGKNKLYIVVDGASSANASSEIRLRLNTDTGSNYLQASLYNLKGTGADSNRDSSATAYLLGIMGTSSTSDVFAAIQIDGTNATGRKPINHVSSATGTGSWSVAGCGDYKGTSAITSISLNSSTGNFDGGTVFVYGA